MDNGHLIPPGTNVPQVIQKWSITINTVNYLSELTCGFPVEPSKGSVDVNGETASFSLGSEITYGCDEGLFPLDVRTSTCTGVGGRGEWVENPGSLVCREKPGEMYREMHIHL